MVNFQTSSAIPAGPDPTHTITSTVGINGNNEISPFDPAFASSATPSVRLENGTEIFGKLQGFAAADTPESSNQRQDLRTLQVSLYIIKPRFVLMCRPLEDHCQGRKSILNRRPVFSSPDHSPKWKAFLPRKTYTTRPCRTWSTMATHCQRTTLL
jgi:hypothetical protein